MADLNDQTTDVSIHNETTDAAVTTTTDGSKERLDGHALIAGTAEVSGTTTNVSVNSEGYLNVVQRASAIPEGATGVKIGAIVTPIKNGGFTDTTYTITNGQTIHLLEWTVGTEATTAKFELYYDPDADMGVNAVLLNVAYLNVSNFRLNLFDEYDGDGTARMVLRATNNTNINLLEFAQYVEAYEETT